MFDQGLLWMMFLEDATRGGSRSCKSSCLDKDQSRWIDQKISVPCRAGHHITSCLMLAVANRPAQTYATSSLPVTRPVDPKQVHSASVFADSLSGAESEPRGSGALATAVRPVLENVSPSALYAMRHTTCFLII